MGRRNYLIEGISGAGKTAVCTELQRRGYQAIHGDRELVYRGDPETGLPTAPETRTPTATWMSEHQIWDVEKVMGASIAEPRFADARGKGATGSYALMPRFPTGCQQPIFRRRCGQECLGHSRSSQERNWFDFEKRLQGDFLTSKGALELHLPPAGSPVRTKPLVVEPKAATHWVCRTHVIGWLRNIASGFCPLPCSLFALHHAADTALGTLADFEGVGFQAAFGFSTVREADRSLARSASLPSSLRGPSCRRRSACQA